MLLSSLYNDKTSCKFSYLYWTKKISMLYVHACACTCISDSLDKKALPKIKNTVSDVYSSCFSASTLTLL